MDNDYKRMLEEYVYPLVGVTLFLAILFLGFSSIGDALDKETNMQDSICNHYRKVTND